MESVFSHNMLSFRGTFINAQGNYVLNHTFYPSLTFVNYLQFPTFDGCFKASSPLNISFSNISNHWGFYTSDITNGTYNIIFDFCNAENLTNFMAFESSGVTYQSSVVAKFASEMKTESSVVTYQSSSATKFASEMKTESNYVTKLASEMKTKSNFAMHQSSEIILQSSEIVLQSSEIIFKEVFKIHL
ncbi:MAG: hypothetical protein WCH34_12645 [Bacteroidota bacterium]